MERLLTNTIYQFMFENSDEAILLAQPDGRVYRANPAACEMFQRTEEEICQLGRPCVVDIN
ncbi:MAG: PAS domain-containing protein, partial [Clostridiales bacterium]|nr:PAS domain-containing protein [Clostridiales bacterium]